MIDEARRDVPPSTSPDVERSFATLEAVYRVRGGDKTAIASIPPPANGRDLSKRATLGIVNLDTGNAEAAARYFKEILDSTVPSRSTDAALAPMYYGRALTKLGRAGEARAAYERFFAIWKSADADIPLLVSAKQEYSRLQKS
jgi:tetratricopeptide (TPR) repeat protein